MVEEVEGWDIGSLLWGAAMLVGGWLLPRSERRETSGPVVDR